MNNVNLEKIFNTTYKKLKKVKKLEIALRGGEFHLIEFEDNKIKKSSTKSDYYFSIRGIYKRNYFSFNSPIQDDLSNIIKAKQKEKYKGIKYPFLKKMTYRDNNTLNINFEEFNNLLLIELISKPVFKLLNDKFIINGKIFLKKDRISPYSNDYPIVSIINNEGLFAKHKQTKIVLDLSLKQINKNEIKINKIFNSTEELNLFFSSFIKNLEEKNKLSVIKNYEIKENEKIVFSSKSIAKILHNIKDQFSTTNYLKNKENIFKDKLNKKIFSHKINIQDTAYHPILQISPFDEIGEERSIVNIFNKGYLRELTSSYYESAKYKIPLTGHSFLDKEESTPFSLYLKGSDKTLESVLSNHKEILYIEDLELTEKIVSLKSELKVTIKNSSILYKNGKASKLIKDLNISISLEDLFMKVAETTIEKEELGLIIPDLVINL